MEATTASLETRMKQVKEFKRIVAHNLRGPSGTMHMLIEMFQKEVNEA
jgi:hypothetical protein